MFRVYRNNALSSPLRLPLCDIFSTDRYSALLLTSIKHILSIQAAQMPTNRGSGSCRDIPASLMYENNSGVFVRNEVSKTRGKAGLCFNKVVWQRRAAHTHIHIRKHTHALTPDRARGGPAAPGPQHLLSGIMHVSFQMLPLSLNWSGDLPVMRRPQIMR